MLSDSKIAPHMQGRFLHALRCAGRPEAPATLSDMRMSSACTFAKTEESGLASGSRYRMHFSIS